MIKSFVDFSGNRLANKKQGENCIQLNVFGYVMVGVTCYFMVACLSPTHYNHISEAFVNCRLGGNILFLSYFGRKKLLNVLFSMFYSQNRRHVLLSVNRFFLPLSYRVFLLRTSGVRNRTCSSLRTVLWTAINHILGLCTMDRCIIGN